jgi:hypothetical protein
MKDIPNADFAAKIPIVVDQILDKVRDFVRQDPDFTFLPHKEMVEKLLGALEGQGLSRETFRPHVKRLVREEVESLLREESTWPTTDCDRLNAAFAELDSSGIVAHQHWACCRRCAARQIEEEIDEMFEAGVAVTGYVFYDIQDTELAIKTGKLCLEFHAVPDDNGGAATIDLGLDVTNALRKQGLSVQWDCNPKHPIEVKVVWKRRLDLCARKMEAAQ